MPVVIPLSQMSPIPPFTLEGAVTIQSWVYMYDSLQSAQQQGCCWGCCFTLLCTLLIGPIGIIIGLCGCAVIATNQQNALSLTACNNANNIFYGGRRVFEWQNMSLSVYPELARSEIAVVIQQPNIYVPYPTATTNAYYVNVPTNHIPVQMAYVQPQQQQYYVDNNINQQNQTIHTNHTNMNKNDIEAPPPPYVPNNEYYTNRPPQNDSISK